jgi:hypothetical protein
MASQPIRSILFRRDFRGLTGGHLKVWDYFCHARTSAGFLPQVFLEPGSERREGNPWDGLEPPPLADWRPRDADVLFVAGVDWLAVPEPIDVPVINLIQGVRHADPADPRRAFLARPATRICVSAEVADAIASTGLVRGPVHVIPNGIEVGVRPRPGAGRDIPVLIAGAKNPSLAVELASRLGSVGIRSECLRDRVPRGMFLELLARAEVAVTLPLHREGFFLPALEAMMLGAIVVCPDCVGNRGFCRDAVNAMVPPHELDPIVAAVRTALAMGPAESGRMLHAASATCAAHSIERERAAFLAILDAM